MSRVDLEERLDRWTGEAIISAAQAAEIRALEEAEEPRSRGPLVAEALGEVGAVLAIGAIAVVAGDRWDELAFGTRMAIVGVPTAVAFVAGALLRNRPAPVAQRLTSLLWAVTALGTAWLAGLIANEADLSDGGVGLTVGLSLTAVAGGLWLVRPRVLQHVALASGVAVTAIAAVVLAAPDPESWVPGLVLFLVGAAWLAATIVDLLPPRTAGEVMGMLGAASGAQIVAYGDTRLAGLVIGTATAAALVALGIGQRRTVVLIGGAIAALQFLPQLVVDRFGASLGAAFTLLVVGLGLIGGAVVVARRWRGG